MYRLEREDFVKPRYMYLWALLAFQAGYLNAFGFLACGRYISHVTGVGTQLGVSIAESKFLLMLELMGFPAFFILGSFLSGVLTIAGIEQGSRPRYDIVTRLLPVLILALLLLGVAGSFGPFGEQLVLPRDVALLYLLSMICGMQNGCFATLTRGQIRTTHLTGISTDIGTDLSRLWFGKLQGKELELTRLTNLTRFKTVIAFSLGSIASVLVSQRMEYGSLIVPLLTSVGVVFAVQAISRELDQRFGIRAEVQASTELLSLKQ